MATTIDNAAAPARKQDQPQQLSGWSESEDTTGWGGLISWGWGAGDEADAAPREATPTSKPQPEAPADSSSHHDQQQQPQQQPQPQEPTFEQSLLYEVNAGIGEVAEEARALTSAVGGLINSVCQRAAALVLWGEEGQAPGGGSDVGGRRAQRQRGASSAVDQADAEASSPADTKNKQPLLLHPQPPPRRGGARSPQKQQRQQHSGGASGARRPAAGLTPASRGGAIRDVQRLHSAVSKLQQEQARTLGELAATRQMRDELETRMVELSLQPAGEGAAAAAASPQRRRPAKTGKLGTVRVGDATTATTNNNADELSHSDAEGSSGPDCRRRRPFHDDSAASFEAAVAAKVQDLVAQRAALLEENAALRRQNGALLDLLAYARAADASASGSAFGVGGSCPLYFQTPAGSQEAACSGAGRAAGAVQPLPPQQQKHTVAAAEALGMQQQQEEEEKKRPAAASSEGPAASAQDSKSLGSSDGVGSRGDAGAAAGDPGSAEARSGSAAGLQQMDAAASSSGRKAGCSGGKEGASSSSSNPQPAERDEADTADSLAATRRQTGSRKHAAEAAGAAEAAAAALSLDGAEVETAGAADLQQAARPSSPEQGDEQQPKQQQQEADGAEVRGEPSAAGDAASPSDQGWEW